MSADVRLGSFTSFPPSRRVRFAPRPDIGPMPAFMSTRPTARPKICLLKSRRSTHAGRRAVGTARSWRGTVQYAPRTAGAYDSHHRTEGIAGRTRRHGRGVAARRARAAAITNLSRPGGNVSGIFVRQIELAAKRVEIAREAFPRATLVGIAFDTVSREQRDAAAEAARKLGLEPRLTEVKGAQGYNGAFSAMDNAPGQPIILPASPLSCATAPRSRKHCSSTAFRRSRHSGRTWRPVR